MFLRNLTMGTALSAVLAGSLLAGPATAADLDPALESPEQVYGSLPVSNVVFGSGWYVRGDAAATNAYKVGVEQPTARSFATAIHNTGSLSYNFSLGGGYALTRYFRGDVIADFFQPSQDNRIGDAQCYTGGTGCTLVGQLNRYDALANGYFDLGTWWIATPYVGVGAGVAFGNVSAKLYGGRQAYQGYLGYHNFAYAGMAGVAFDVYPHVKVDVGYRYVDNGRVLGTDIHNNEVRAGLRYMIDN